MVTSISESYKIKNIIPGDHAMLPLFYQFIVRFIQVLLRKRIFFPVPYNQELKTVATKRNFPYKETSNR